MSPQPLFSFVVALLSAEETDSFPNAPSTDIRPLCEMPFLGADSNHYSISLSSVYQQLT